MPTFNQSKPDDEGEPAARQLTAEDRELMLKTGLPPEVADAYMAGGTFTCVDEAVKHYRAQAEAAPAPARTSAAERTGVLHPRLRRRAKDPCRDRRPPHLCGRGVERHGLNLDGRRPFRC